MAFVTTRFWAPDAVVWPETAVEAALEPVASCVTVTVSVTVAAEPDDPEPPHPDRASVAAMTSSGVWRSAMRTIGRRR